jgi:DivIVA domain-containing protein
MGQFLLLLVVALTVGAVVFGVTVLLTGGDRGLSTAEPDGQAVPLPGTRPLAESDIATVRFDVALRGYRMAQVDQAMRRAAYDIGYKDELINVLEAEVEALRSGRLSDADVLRRAREAAQDATVPGSSGVDDIEAAEIELGPLTAEPADAEASSDADGERGMSATEGASLAEHLDDRSDQDDRSGEPAAAAPISDIPADAGSFGADAESGAGTGDSTGAESSAGAAGSGAGSVDGAGGEAGLSGEGDEPGAEVAADKAGAEQSESGTALPSRR